MEGAAHGFTQHHIGIVEGVEGDRLRLAYIHMAVRVQHALIHADVDDLAYHAAGFGVIADQLAFQRDGQLGNQGRIHEGGFFGVEASLGKLIRLLVARHQTHIIARGHVLRIRHADGKGTARQDILGGLVPSADAHGNLLILADAARAASMALGTPFSS